MLQSELFIFLILEGEEVEEAHNDYSRIACSLASVA